MSMNLLTGNNLKNWNVCFTLNISVWYFFLSVSVPFILFGGGFDKKERFLLSFFSRLLTLKWRRRSNSIKIVWYSFYLLPKKRGNTVSVIYYLCVGLFILSLFVRMWSVCLCLCGCVFLFYFILRHEWRFFWFVLNTKILSLFFLNRGTFRIWKKFIFFISFFIFNF